MFKVGGSGLKRHDLEITVDPVGQLLVRFGGPRPLGLRVVAKLVLKIKLKNKYDSLDFSLPIDR